MSSYLYELATDRRNGFVAGLIKAVLFILSLIYGLVVRILILFSAFKYRRIGCKVISVGNITLGGTGKTPLVELIARYLSKDGRKVAILSRGYKKVTSDQLPVTSCQTMGDEPFMLKEKLKDIPVIVDANRIRAASRALKDFKVDTVILDDGFQQWGIAKDLEVVTIDANNPFGNRNMLPRGILREPLSSLKRADVFVVSKANIYPDELHSIKEYLRKINPQAVTVESVYKPAGFYNIREPEKLLPVDTLKGKSVALFSGIAEPDSFKKLIESIGLKVVLSFSFGDHHNYTEKDIKNIIEASKAKAIDTIITTEKDSARLYNLRLISLRLIDISPQVLVLRIELAVKDEQRFFSRLHQLYSF